MKCMHCGAEMPEGANYCAKCARPLKSAVSEEQSSGVMPVNPSVQENQPQAVVLGKPRTNWGLPALLIGIISLVLSCIYLGFFGIIGIILGIIALKKREPKRGKAVVGIICSAVAFCISICVVAADTDDTLGDTTYQAEQSTGKDQSTSKNQSTEVSAEPTVKPSNTPKPTLSPAEQQKNIQKALRDRNEKDLKKYSSTEVSQAAGDILKNLPFKEAEDYKTATQIAGTMVSLYPDGKDVKKYKSIVSNYKLYTDTKEEKNSNKYKGINKKWDNASEAASHIISETFYVRYDLEANKSESTLDQIINAITQEAKEYKHAYYAQGSTFDFTLGWLPDDDAEYVIYTQSAFPKAGKYALELIPTGDTMKLSDDRGFERNVSTYTIFSEEDREEYERIGQLKFDYDELGRNVKEYKENIETICVSFTEQRESSNSDEEAEHEYIFPKSDVKKLTIEEIKKLSKSDIRLAKNEIYARHGRKFKDAGLQSYFDGKSWYVGIIEPDDFDESVFNKIEKYNIRLLAKYENL